MANNRMYMICKHCLESNNASVNDCLFYMGKYYPSTGWYTKEDFQRQFNEWLDQHQHGTLFGDYMITALESQIGGPFFKTTSDLSLALEKCTAHA